MIDYDDEITSCSRCYVTLCIYHLEIGPADLIQTLGFEPDHQICKGEKTGLGAVAKRNGIFFSTKDMVESKDIRRHLDTICDVFGGQKEFFAHLNLTGGQTLVSCFWESSSNNGGPFIEQRLLQRLADMNVDLQFDVWAK